MLGDRKRRHERHDVTKTGTKSDQPRFLWLIGSRDFLDGNCVIEVEFLTRVGCHLCDEMKDALEQAALGLDLHMKETDIDTDEELAARYGNDVPVLFVNGSKAFKHRATVKQLRARLVREVTKRRA